MVKLDVAARKRIIYPGTINLFLPLYSVCIYADKDWENRERARGDGEIINDKPVLDQTGFLFPFAVIY